MKVLMKLTSVVKLTDDKLLVQLQGKYGNAQLQLPVNQQDGLRVGDEYTVEHSTGMGFIGELDESKEHSTAMAKLRGAIQRSQNRRGWTAAGRASIAGSASAQLLALP